MDGLRKRAESSIGDQNRIAKSPPRSKKKNQRIKWGRGLNI
tara:strand:- start:293 stop:415 length:123 start_codon:yes stop_codon:yes gene_type:complete